MFPKVELSEGIVMAKTSGNAFVSKISKHLAVGFIVIATKSIFEKS